MIGIPNAKLNSDFTEAIHVIGWSHENKTWVRDQL